MGLGRRACRCPKPFRLQPLNISLSPSLDPGKAEGPSPRAQRQPRPHTPAAPGNRACFEPRTTPRGGETHPSADPFHTRTNLPTLQPSLALEPGRPRAQGIEVETQPGTRAAPCPPASARALRVTPLARGRNPKAPGARRDARAGAPRPCWPQSSSAA